MNDSEYITKQCLLCGKPIPVHISKRGYKESPKQYEKHKYCSNTCRIKSFADRRRKRCELTEENYYSVEMNMKYVSASQYKMFFDIYGNTCEAAALAEIKGEWAKPVTKSLLVGSYVDEALTGDLEKFKEGHSELYLTRGERKGELKAEFMQAEDMVQRAKRDATFLAYVTGGQHQVIYTGEINGVPVKIKIDHVAYKNGKPVAIVDLKTVKSMYESFYVKDSGEHLNFIQRWNYDLQGAMYQYIFEQNTGLKLPFYIAAISKDKDSEGVSHPRLKVIQIPQVKMDERIVEIKNNIGKIQALKQGKIEPVNCGRCDYCADTLPCEVISMNELTLDL